MIYESQINELIAQWTSRAGNSSYPQDYRDGLNECIYDLEFFLKQSLEEEAIAREHDNPQNYNQCYSGRLKHEPAA